MEVVDILRLDRRFESLKKTMRIYQNYASILDTRSEMYFFQEASIGIQTLFDLSLEKKEQHLLLKLDSELSDLESRLSKYKLDDPNKTHFHLKKESYETVRRLILNEIKPIFDTAIPKITFAIDFFLK